jgi:hypothetical protein
MCALWSVVCQARENYQQEHKDCTSRTRTRHIPAIYTACSAPGHRQLARVGGPARPCMHAVKTLMTERGTKHSSAQIKIDLFSQMRAGWWGSCAWGKMGGHDNDGIEEFLETHGKGDQPSHEKTSGDPR